MSVLIIRASGGSDDAPVTVPPSALDDVLDDDLHGFITDRKNPRDRVLVIDDDQDILDALEEILTQGGFEAEVARGGKQGLLKLLSNQRHPDCILLDWTMPDIDGGMVHDLLRRSGEYSGIPILIISASAQAARDVGAMNDEGRIFLSDPTREAKIAARRAGRLGTIPPPRTSLLPKPFDLDGLYETVRKAIRKGREHA